MQIFMELFYKKKHTQYLTTLDVSNKPNNYNYDIL